MIYTENIYKSSLETDFRLSDGHTGDHGLKENTINQNNRNGHSYKCNKLQDGFNFHKFSPPLVVSGCVSPLHFFEHAISGLVPTLNRGLFGLVECRGRTSQNISLINSNVVRSFWHDSFLLWRSLLTSLGSALSPTFIEKKTATVSQIFNLSFILV
jgi:hypothetical protein